MCLVIIFLVVFLSNIGRFYEIFKDISEVFYSKELLQNGITLLLTNPISTGDILLVPEGFLHGKSRFQWILTLKKKQFYPIFWNKCSLSTLTSDLDEFRWSLILLKIFLSTVLLVNEIHQETIFFENEHSLFGNISLVKESINVKNTNVFKKDWI